MPSELKFVFNKSRSICELIDEDGFLDEQEAKALTRELRARYRELGSMPVGSPFSTATPIEAFADNKPIFKITNRNTANNRTPDIYFEPIGANWIKGLLDFQQLQSLLGTKIESAPSSSRLDLEDTVQKILDLQHQPESVQADAILLAFHTLSHLERERKLQKLLQQTSHPSTERKPSPRFFGWIGKGENQ